MMLLNSEDMRVLRMLKHEHHDASFEEEINKRDLSDFEMDNLLNED